MVNAPLYEAMVAHVQQIEQAVQQQQMQAALAQAGGPPQGEGKPEGPDGSAVQAAVESGALVPAGARQSPLDAMVQAGGLVPAGVNGQAPGSGVSVDALMAEGALTPVLPEAPGRPQ